MAKRTSGTRSIGAARRAYRSRSVARAYRSACAELVGAYRADYAHATADASPDGICRVGSDPTVCIPPREEVRGSADGSPSAPSRRDRVGARYGATTVHVPGADGTDRVRSSVRAGSRAALGFRAGSTGRRTRVTGDTGADASHSHGSPYAPAPTGMASEPVMGGALRDSTAVHAPTASMMGPARHVKPRGFFTVACDRTRSSAWTRAYMVAWVHALARSILSKCTHGTDSAPIGADSWSLVRLQGTGSSAPRGMRLGTSRTARRINASRGLFS